MARQASIEKWRERALNSEADRDHFVKLVRKLLRTDTSFETWNKNRDVLAKFLALFPREV